MSQRFAQFCCAAFAFLCAWTLAAGESNVAGASLAPQMASAPYAFDNYGSETGLPGTVVNIALQTNDGYLWVGTPSGLGRFDGVRFTNFRPPEEPDFIGESIHCLHQDQADVLWVGTAGGLVRYEHGTFAQAGLRGISVRALAETADGALWIATAGSGLWLYRQGHLEAFRDKAIPSNSSIRMLFADSQGRLWIALDRARGVFRYENGAIQRVDGGEPPLSEIATMAEWPKGTLWFGTQRLGLFRLRDNAWVSFGTLGQAPRAPITDLRVTRDHTLWIAAGTLLHATDPENFVPETTAGLPNDNVRATYEDREGGLWLCAGAEGLIRMRAMQYASFSTAEGLPSNNVKTVSQDTTGHLWLGLQHLGVVEVTDAGKIKLHDESAGLPTIDPAVVCAATDGTIWAGINSRLFVRREGDWKRHSDLRFVRGIFEDQHGNMWIGTEGQGVFRFEAGHAVEVKQASGQPILVATTFSESADGTMYIGTWRSGVFRVSGSEITPYDKAHGLPNDDVRAVHIDRSGTLWVGLAGRGLAVLDHGRWLNPDTLAAMSANHVSAIAQDEFDRLWLGTPAGIMWARRTDLLAAARGETAVPAVHVIAAGTDTRTLPVWSGGQPIVWQTRNQELLFATRRGVVAIDPKQIASNDVLPPVHIEKVLVDRHPADFAHGVELPAGARSLAIDYTALSFAQPGHVLFKYKLEGYDADWIDAGTRRAAVYNRLPPGNFVFRVTASNNDGVWNMTGARLALVQHPYFYQTRWFIALLVAAAALCMLGIYQWSHRRLRLRLERLEQERAMENERRRIAQDLHDDLGARLTEISLFAESAIRTSSSEAKQEMSLLSERVRQIVSALDAIVWAVNPENDSLDDLVAYLANLFQELFRRSSIRARIEVASDIPASDLTAEERSNLFLAAKEAMNNTLKHSGATEAWLRVQIDHGELRIVIQDNGRGFDPAAPETDAGNGLANIRRRIAKIGGVAHIDTEIGRGTTTSIRIPMHHRVPGSSTIVQH